MSDKTTSRPWIQNRLFLDEHVDITGIIVRECLFDGCIVHLEKDMYNWVQGCQFVNCKLVGAGWPEQWRNTPHG